MLWELGFHPQPVRSSCTVLRLCGVEASSNGNRRNRGLFLSFFSYPRASKDPESGHLLALPRRDAAAPFWSYSAPTCVLRPVDRDTAGRLHLAKFERAVLGLLLASNALGAPDESGGAAVDVSHPPPTPSLTTKHAPPCTPYITLHTARADPSGAVEHQSSN
jgi:hypothetical protein